MKRILFSTFLVGSSLLFGDLYASNSFNDVDTANVSSTKSRRPNTFKSIVEENEGIPLEEHENRLSDLKREQEEKERIAREEEEKKAAAVPVYKSEETLRKEIAALNDFGINIKLRRAINYSAVQSLAKSLNISLIEEL